LACAAKQRVIEGLQEEVERLRRKNQAQEAKIGRLQERLEQAQRAGKRQAAPFSKGPAKEHPKRPGRKPGAAYGKKARRPVPAHVHETHEAPLPPVCPHCGGHQLEDVRVEEQFEEEIPPVEPHVKRFRIHVGKCLACGHRVQGHHPLQTSDALGAARVHLGPRAMALAARLVKDIGMSLGKTSAVLRQLFSLSITPGGLSQIQERVANSLTPTSDALAEQVPAAPVVGVDETGWKVGGHLEWLWAFTTPTVTVYRILPGRGFEEACIVLPLDFHGILLRDGWAPYRRFQEATHQTCIGGHILRRCHEILETADRGGARFPHAIRRILLRSLHLRDLWIEEPPSPRGRAIHLGILRAEMDRFLAWNPKEPENRKFLKHLRNERDALFTFLAHPETPASNWWGEQAIRPAVVTRKIWGGNRTAAGATTQSVLMTVFRTAHQQGADPIELIEDVLRSPQPRLAALPSLLPGP
jgi:transposase